MQTDGAAGFCYHSRMIGRLLHALLASCVVAGAAAGASYGVTHWIPEGPTRQALELWVTAPGQAVYVRLKKDPAARKKVETGRARLEKAGLDLKRFQDSLVGVEMTKGAAETRRLLHLYNVSAWAAAGFAVCLALTLLFGIESIFDALTLGVRVTLALIFLQGALILGGVLALSKLKG
jgi:hypothetical protein